MGIDQCPGLDHLRLGFELQGHGFKQFPVQVVRNHQPAKSDEGGALRRRFTCLKSAEAAKGGTIVERLGQLHVGQIVPDRKKQRPEHRDWRPGGFPFAGRVERVKKRCH